MSFQCLFLVVLGDFNVQTSEALERVFRNAGYNPFDLIKKSIKYIWLADVFSILFYYTVTI